MDPVDPVETIRAHIASLLPEGRRGFRDDTPLFEKGYLDSFNMAAVIAFIEKEFRVRFTALDVSLENLGTVSKMARFVRRKRAG